MNTALECIPCFVRQAEEAVEMCALENPRRERLLRRLLREIADADWAVMPVMIAQRLQRIIRAETGVADPYRALKDSMNHVALELMPAMTAAVRRHADPHEAAVRLAIAGNMLDAGSKTRLMPADLPARLNSLWTMPLVGDIEALFDAARAADNILYLADNAGEIVFDRLLIEALPVKKITVAVRGAPVINDATLADAATAGIPAIAPVISNGSDAPGTLVQECSEEFRSCFDAADLIVAKGQGNYETLSDTHKNIFFLLTVKCPLIATAVGASVGKLVVHRRSAKKSKAKPKH
ncbi:MAG: ARMT1-like domain-containing protein [Verrucomicrobiota bacterium]